MDENMLNRIQKELSEIEKEMSCLREKRDKYRKELDNIREKNTFEERKLKYIGKCYKINFSVRIPKYEKITFLKVIDVVSNGRYALCICIIDHKYEKGICIEEIPLWDYVYPMALALDKGRPKIIDYLSEIKSNDFYEYATNCFTEIITGGCDPV